MTKHHEIITKLTNLMGFETEIETIESENGSVLNIKSEDSSLLIGRGGENLKALQHITNLILYSDGSFEDNRIRFQIDVDNYRHNQKQNLLRTIDRVIQQVRRSTRPEVLQPMSAYDRKTVHMELSKHADLFTESIGEEPNRRIVVKIKK